MRLRNLSALSLVVSVALLCPFVHRESVSASSGGAKAPPADQSRWVADNEGDTFVYYDDGAGAACRPATVDEAANFARRDENLELHVIRPQGPSLHAAGNINIVLRSTTQLDGFPAAKSGFIAAAARWQDRLQSQTPITIVLDVDFGPTRFGTPFGTGVLGATATQS